MPATDPIMTMWPSLAATMAGRKARVRRRTPFRFVSIVSSQSASFPFSIGSRPRARPALLTRTCTGPCARTAWAKRATLASSVTSSSCVVRRAPGTLVVIWRAVASSLSWRRAPRTSSAPTSARASAVAAPIPAEAPVTTARFPSSRMSTSGLNIADRTPAPDAVAAKTVAVAAKTVTVAAETGAVAAKTVAVAAKTVAVAAETGAVAAKTVTVAAETGAVAAKTVTVAAETVAVAAKTVAVAAKTGGVAAKTVTVAAETGAGAAKTVTVAAETGAGAAKTVAVAAKTGAGAAKTVADAAKTP